MTTMEERHALCPTYGHPGGCYHPGLDRTWCVCGDRTYPGDVVDMALTRCDGPLSAHRDLYQETTDMTSNCQVPDHGPSGSETLPRLHHHGPSGERLGHGRFDNCRHCQSGMPLFEAAIPEPIFPPQECLSCGREHPGEPCDAYDTDLFGGAS